jgi:hypothetical protein
MTAAATPNQAATWSSWRELPRVIAAPVHIRRTATIALVVGTVFVAMNQLEIILSGQATTIVWLKVGLTYLTPLCVSNLGILSATRRPSDSGAKQR